MTDNERKNERDRARSTWIGFSFLLRGCVRAQPRRRLVLLLGYCSSWSRDAHTTLPAPIPVPALWSLPLTLSSFASPRIHHGRQAGGRGPLPAAAHDPLEDAATRHPSTASGGALPLAGPAPAPAGAAAPAGPGGLRHPRLPVPGLLGRVECGVWGQEVRAAVDSNAGWSEPVRKTRNGCWRPRPKPHSLHAPTPNAHHTTAISSTSSHCTTCSNSSNARRLSVAQRPARSAAPQWGAGGRRGCPSWPWPPARRPEPPPPRLSS